MKLGETLEFEGKAAIVVKVNDDGTGNLAMFDENGDSKVRVGVSLPKMMITKLEAAPKSVETLKLAGVTAPVPGAVNKPK